MSLCESSDSEPDEDFDEIYNKRWEYIKYLIEKKQRLEKIVGGIRDYYHTRLMVFSPLPWIHLRIDEIDLVIKQISEGGRDVR